MRYLRHIVSQVKYQRSQLPPIQESLKLAEVALSHFFNRWSRLQNLNDVVREDFRIRLSAANMSVSPH
jgi:hypothetical protein